MSTLQEISEEEEEENNSTPENEQDSTPEQDPTNNPPQIIPPKQDSTTVNPQNDVPNQHKPSTDHNPQKISSCLPLRFTSKTKKPQLKQPAEVQTGNSTPSTYSNIDEISKSIAADIKYITDESQKLDKYKESLQSLLIELTERLELLKKEGNDKEFHDLQKEVTKLKFKIPSKHKADGEEKDFHKSQQHSVGTSITKPKTKTEKAMQQVPRLYKTDLFGNCSEYKGLEALFDGLPVELKLCLLCFAVFPENAIIKKRLLVYWWMAEGFVPPIPCDDEVKRQIEEGKTAEEFAADIFEKLTKMGFIEPVNKKRSFYLGSYKVHPFIRMVLVMLAERVKFVEFNEMGEPTQTFTRSLCSCLVGKGLIDYGDLRAGKVKIKDLEKLHAVINVNEPILEFKKEWLLNMKNLVVLYLGRWTVSATHHIEIEDDEEKDFLDGLKNMAHLRYFSLQGVSRIMGVPEAILNLWNLMILDLRACHNLESIPEGIGSLKNLTHLDISECYLLEHMPKELSLLVELRVLKGFVVVAMQSKNCCSLEDLTKLERLIKLSIYTGLLEFPTDQHLSALQQFKALRKLTIAWGAGELQDEFSKSNKVAKANDEGNKIASSIHTETIKISSEAPPTLDDGGAKKNTEEGILQAQSTKNSETTLPTNGGKKEKVTITEKFQGSKKEAKKTKENPKEKQAKKFAKMPTFSKKPTIKSPTQMLDRLEKLDLKSFPTASTPKWLTPSNLPSLEKLYIRGGKFSDLGQYQDLDVNEMERDSTKKHTWNVKVLRLKYLSELEMDWTEMQELVPELTYLEKVNCPKLSFFPCDGYGVWVNKEKLKHMQGRSCCIY